MMGFQHELDPESDAFAVCLLVSAGRGIGVFGALPSTRLYSNQRCSGRGLPEADAINAVLCFGSKVFLHIFI